MNLELSGQHEDPRLAQLLKRFPSEVIFQINEISSKRLKYLEPTHPYYAIAESLIHWLPEAASVLVSEDAIKTIVKQPQPVAWIERRARVIQKLGMLGKDFVFPPDLLLNLNEEVAELVLNTPDMTLRSILLHQLTYNKQRDLFDQYLKIVSRLSREVVSNEGSEFFQLLAGRPSWLVELERAMGFEDLEETLTDSEAVKKLLKASQAAHLDGILCLTSAKESEMRHKYGQLEIKDESGADMGINEMLETVEELRKILVRCVQRIRVGQEREEVLGNFSLDIRGRRVIEISANERASKMRMPGTLVHEIGHAFEQLLGGRDRGQQLYDRFAIRVLYGTEPHVSLYAESYAVEDKENVLFIKESFAEDFRIFLTYPAALPERRFENMQEIFRQTAPEVDPEAIRDGLQTIYGRFYGVSPQEAQEPVNCELVKKQKEVKLRARQEAQRERAKKTLNN